MSTKKLRRALISSAATLALPFAASAQGADEKKDEIVVVGSAIRTATSDTTAQPVQVLSRERLDITPAVSVADFLQELPIVSGGVSNATNDEFNGGRSSINLRGLGAQYTLVLVNGRRLGGENIPDIGAIPPEAVESVEVLKTGASAIYGSDAVAGVVNIKLRENFQGLELHTSYGELTRGGGENFRVSSLFGLEEGPFSFSGSFAYQEDKGFQKFERELTRSRDARPFGGFDARSGTMTEPAAFFPASGGAFVIDTNALSPGDVATDLGDFAPRTNDFAMSGQEQDKLPPQERWSAHWNSTYEFAEDGSLEFYTSGYVDNRQRSFRIHPSLTSFTVDAANPNNPFGEDVRFFYLFSPTEDVPAVDLGATPASDLIRIDSNTLNVQGVAGFRGDLGESLNWDVGYTYFRNRANLNQRNDISLERAQAAVDSGAFNPFCFFCNDTAVRDSLRADYLIQQVNTVQTLDATLSGDVIDWSQGTIQFAAGYQYRDSFFSNRPDFARQTNSFWWNGAPETEEEGQRSVNAVFGELRVPLYNNPNASFFEAAEVSGAVRHEDYSDFGGATVWQVLGRLAFLDEQLLLRGSYAKTFRAPSLAALNTPITTQEQGGLTIFDPTSGSIVTELNITAGGNPDLDPEIGNTLNVGAIIRPNAIEGLFFSLDYFETQISDIIRVPDLLGLFNGTESAGTVDRSTTPISIDTRLDNGGELSVAGFDIGANYTTELPFADLSFFFNATRLTDFTETANSVETELLGEYSGAFRAISELRMTTGFILDRGPLDFAFTFNYASGVRDVVPGTDIDRTTNAYDTFDVQVGYDLGEAVGDDFGGGILNNVSLYVGADNVFDHDPVFLAEDGDFVLEDGPNTLLGRFVYAGVRKRF